MRSVVKHSYIKAGARAKSAARAHLHYIQHRSGHDKEVGGRQFFDRDSDGSDGKWFRNELNEAPGYGTVMHKLILSPGHSGVDLRDYTREVMETLGDSKGLELNWQAIIHTNTDHDHVHVVLLGRDRNGKSVRLNRQDHDVCRSAGDRYLERKHEFDRYFDKSIDRLFKEESRSLDLDRIDRGIDLDKLFEPYRPDEKENKPGKHKEKRQERFERSEPRSYIPQKRKSRKQRLREARGRNDFYHDLYVSNMNKQRLMNLRESQPERAEQIDKELAQQQAHDEERRATIARQVAQLDRILGLIPKKQKDRKEEREEEPPVESSQGGAKDDRSNSLLDEFIDKKKQLEKNKEQQAIRALELEYLQKLFKKDSAQAPKPDLKPENESKDAEKKEPKPEKQKEIEPSFEPIPDPSQLELRIEEPKLADQGHETPSSAESLDERASEAIEKLDEFEKLLEEFQKLIEQRIIEQEKLKMEKEREEKEREDKEKEEEREEEER